MDRSSRSFSRNMLSGNERKYGQLVEGFDDQKINLASTPVIGRQQCLLYASFDPRRNETLTPSTVL